MTKTFGGMQLVYHNITDQNADIQMEYFDVSNMTEMKMMIETRPRYPSNTLTFTIANITKHKSIFCFNIELNLNERFDVDVVLEDSQRNFLGSFICYNICFY